MGLLHPIAYIATGLAFCFFIFSLACGLYYLAELVEEHSVYTKKVIRTITYVVISLHVLFWIFDCLPFLYLLFSVLCHFVYSLNLKTFPFINLSSIAFISSCILVFADHFLWFRYFTAHYKPFMDIAAFFGLCVWLVPFAYFISLSANDNALPISDSSFIDNIPHQHKQGLLKTLLGYFGIKQQEVPNESLDYTNNTNYHRSATNTITTTHEGIQNRKAI
ncbi:unnamed protein product [Rhizopus microsporus]